MRFENSLTTVSDDKAIVFAMLGSNLVTVVKEYRCTFSNGVDYRDVTLMQNDAAEDVWYLVERDSSMGHYELNRLTGDMEYAEGIYEGYENSIKESEEQESELAAAE